MSKIRSWASALGAAILFLAFWFAVFVAAALVKGWPLLLLFGLYFWWATHNRTGPWSGTRAEEREARKRIRMEQGIGDPGFLERWRKENPGRLTPRDEQLRNIAARQPK